MAEFRISIDLDVVLDAATAAVDETVLPLLAQAVRAVAQQTQVRWAEAVYRAKLWDGEKTAYMDSIQMKMTGPFSALVWSDYEHAEEIETGRPARDMKRMLDTSMKVRVSKNGKRYLVIPFRHNAPGGSAHAPEMPAFVYAMAKQLTPSRVVGQGTRVSGTGAFDVKTKKHFLVTRNLYKWGESLSFGPDANPRGMAGWGRDKRYQGMYRFLTTTPGGGRSSSYLTFRTMMEGSPGWIIPAQPGLHLAENVSREMQPLAEQAFTEAVRRMR